MNANSKRSGNDETAGTGDDFESGLDYGAFAEDDPDFPDDHLDAENTGAADGGGDAALKDGPAESGATASQAASASAPSDGEPTTAVPKPTQDETRPLGGAAGQTRAADAEKPSRSSERRQAADAEKAPAGGAAERSEKSASTETAAASPAPVGMAASGSKDSPATSPADVASEDQDVERTADLSAVRDPAGATAATAEEPAPVAASPTSSSAAGATSERTPEPYRPRETAAAPAAVSRTESGDEITEADLDEEVARDKRGASRVFQVLIAIFVPVLVMVAAIRLVASPVFLWIAYNRPGFPQDGAGFGTDDRLVYGSYGVDYLFNAADSRYLAELAPGGETLFADAEVSHMTDVKWVMLITMAVGLLLLVLTLIFALLLRRWRPGGVARGVFAGAWVTLGLVIAVAVLAVLSWQQFFDAFHRVLFEEGTWTFSEDSALIRLYPEQFWMDAGIAVVGLVVVIAVLALIVTWPTRRRRARRQARLEEIHSIRRQKLVTELSKDAEYSNAPRRRR